MDIFLVLFDKESVRIYMKEHQKVLSYVDEHYVVEIEKSNEEEIYI